MEYYILDYIKEYIKEIEDDMNIRCENNRKTGTKINTIQTINTIHTTDDIKKVKPNDGLVIPELQSIQRTKKAGATRKKRKEISTSASKSLTFHNVPTTLIFD
jgi:hypothetical protein